MSSEKNPTRNRILKATLSLLESNGGTATRMSDIAKATGISRQAVYLHFPNRAELLIAAVRHVDEINGVDSMLEASRNAPSGKARLDAWVEVWGTYIPRIHGVAKALMAMRETDSEAASAWEDRMNAVRHGCAAVVTALVQEAELSPRLSPPEATDLLFALLSVQTWEALCLDAKWSQERYVTVMQESARRLLLAG